jgi:hypothetical protein
MIRGHSGSFLVMVRGNRALTGRAAGGLIRRPCGSRERRVEQNDYDQADACGNRTAAIVTRSFHIVWAPISIAMHYSVKRHSLQALPKMTANSSIYPMPDAPAIRGMSADSAAATANSCGRGHLDLECGASQTRTMAHSYIKLDFGTDEEKAQQARHKLDGWKQAFRLDKRLLYKLDRPESDAGEAGSKPEPVEKPAPAAKSKGKAAASPKTKAAAKASKPAAEKPVSAANGKVSLLVRLYFSSHEKLSEQRWLERIPSEEPFRSASPKVVHHSDPEFESTDKQFEALE